MKNIILLFLPLCLFACSNSAVKEELKKVKEELTAAETTIQDLKSQVEPEGELVHIVFLKRKADADQAVVIAEIKKLEGIEVVKDLQVGPFENLGDDRALSDYNMIMEMSFDDADAYQVYQVHPIHLALRENTKSFMAGPPATYDYLKK